MRVQVVPADARWPAAFQTETERITRSLVGLDIRLHHIGSTAIPGIPAKPIIDILMEVASLRELDARTPAMTNLGYEALGEFGIPGRRYFRRNDAAGARTHQVHAFAAGSPGITRHLAFRDYMIAHPAFASEYGTLKQRLARQHPDDIEAYMNGKDTFIKHHEAQALAWVTSRSGPLSASRGSIRAAYDTACEAYAQKFLDELDHKPLDREWLQEFAERVGSQRPVLDLGCGPGHTTAHLASLGLSATGVDLSPRMIETAATRFPQAHFVVGDFFALPDESSSVEGILALYCIVHLSPDQLGSAFAEMYRVLRAGGVLLLSFHVGSKVVRAENFLDTGAVLEFTFFEPHQVIAALRTAGFDKLDARIREPCETEYPSRRCYLLAHKPQPRE